MGWFVVNWACYPEKMKCSGEDPKLCASVEIAWWQNMPLQLWPRLHCCSKPSFWPPSRTTFVVLIYKLYAMIFFRFRVQTEEGAVSDCCDYSQCFWERHTLVLLFTGDIAPCSALLREICSPGPAVEPRAWCPEFCRVTAVILRLYKHWINSGGDCSILIRMCPFQKVTQNV